LIERVSIGWAARANRLTDSDTMSPEILTLSCCGQCESSLLEIELVSAARRPRRVKKVACFSEGVTQRRRKFLNLRRRHENNGVGCRISWLLMQRTARTASPADSDSRIGAPRPHAERR
jgi:hypothetical protein